MWYVTKGLTIDLGNVAEALGGGAEFSAYFPDQGVLEWGATHPTENGIQLLGENFPLNTEDQQSAFPFDSNFRNLGTLNRSGGKTWVENTPSFKGLQNAHAACLLMRFNNLGGGFDSEQKKWVRLQIGNRHAVDVLLAMETGGLLTNGKNEWNGHWHNYTTSGSALLPTVSLRLWDVELDQEVASQIIHIAGANPIVCALSAGFCYYNGAPKFVAWASFKEADLNRSDFYLIRGISSNLPVPAFGAGTAFLATDADDSEGFDSGFGGPVELTIPGTGNVIYTAAEKVGPYESTFDPRPMWTAPYAGKHLVESPLVAEWIYSTQQAEDAGIYKSIGSTRAPLANFLSPVDQSIRLEAGYALPAASKLPNSDCGAHRELFADRATLLTDSGTNQFGPVFFLNTHMGYRRCNSCPYLPDDVFSTIHDDENANAALSAVDVQIAVTSPAALGEEINVPLEQQFVVHAEAVGINEYKGSSTWSTEQKTWDVNVLVSLVRKDFVNETGAGLYYYTRFHCVVAVSFWSNNFGYASTFKRLLSQSEWEAVLDGGSNGIGPLISGGDGDRPLTGGVYVKAAG